MTTEAFAMVACRKETLVFDHMIGDTPARGRGVDQSA